MIPARSAQELGYEVFDVIASGGMANVHLARRRGAAGFSRVVAIKRLHPHLQNDPDLAAMLADEARLSARIRHSNVVSVLDVLDTDGLSLVMEYVHGGSLAELLRSTTEIGEGVPPAIASAIVLGVLAGLHAAHEARGEDGAPLHIVHRDVSPQNVLVGADGLARIADFGVAKARVRSHVTREGTLKGKLAYMAPEQLVGQASHKSDLFAMGIVAWELFSGRRFYEGIKDEAHMLGAVSMRAAPPLRPFARSLSDAAIRVVETALQKAPEQRFATAEEMAHALRTALPPAPPHEVGAWAARLMGAKLAQRAALIERIERGEPAGARASDAALLGTATPSGGVGRVTFASGSGPPSFDPLQNAEPSGTVTIDPIARRTEQERRSRQAKARWVGIAAVMIAAGSLAGLVVHLRRGAAPAGAGAGAEAPAVSQSTERANTVSGGPGAAAPTGSVGGGSNVPVGPSSTTAAATGTDAPEPPPAAAGAAATGTDAPEPPAAAASGGRGGTPSGNGGVRTGGTAQPKASGSASAGGKACDPPWRIDSDGIKRIKRECLK